MSALVEEGWVAPAVAGPSPRRALTVLACTVAALVLWGLAGTDRVSDWLAGGDREQLVLRLSTEGELSVVEGDELEVRRRVRTAGGADFVVLTAPVGARGPRLDVIVRGAAGVDSDAIALRVVAPNAQVRRSRAGDGAPKVRVEPARDDDLQLMVTVPVRALGQPSGGDEPSGTLRDVTAPVDRRIAEIRDDRRRLDRLRDAWWIFPLVLVLVGGGVWAWRRAARRFRSMRLPGPGTELAIAPPSSLDPVGAAILVAGAGQVDAPSAFAGHVLDLVERHQLRMRRTMEQAYGAGALIGLAQADEEAVAASSDPAVDLLRSVALEAGATVALPDAVSRVAVAPQELRATWRAHVAARQRFERLLDVVEWRRLAILAIAFAVAALVGAVAGLAADGVGARATAWLAAAVAAPLAFVLGAWTLDGRRWRRVTRARRLERAQWLAWRASAEVGAGPAGDLRNLPLLVATGRDDVAKSFAGPDAVGLAAVTSRTVSSLRTVVDDR